MMKFKCNCTTSLEVGGKWVKLIANETVIESDEDLSKKNRHLYRIDSTAEPQPVKKTKAVAKAVIE